MASICLIGLNDFRTKNEFLMLLHLEFFGYFFLTFCIRFAVHVPPPPRGTTLHMLSHFHGDDMSFIPRHRAMAVFHSNFLTLILEQPYFPLGVIVGGLKGDKIPEISFAFPPFGQQ